MSLRQRTSILIGLTVLASPVAVAVPASDGWTATGTLLEACSCNVPCPCNFGQDPTHSYCHTIYAYRLKSAQYAGVTLDGLVIGGGEGAKGAIGFLDVRATAAQKDALEKLAHAVFEQGGASPGARPMVWTKMVAEENAQHFRIDFEGAGGFQADVLIGRDGKNPVIVENNTTWPVKRFTKGKTTAFRYKDTLGNRLEYEGVNANLGAFQMKGSFASRRSADSKATHPPAITAVAARKDR